MNLCDSCKTWAGCPDRIKWYPARVTVCGLHDSITRADLAARDAEIAGLREVREAVLSAIRGRLAATGFFAMTKRLGDALDASRNPPVNRTTEGAKP